MGFFDEAISAWLPEPAYEYAAWDGPPPGVLPRSSAQEAVIFRTEGAVLHVGQFLCFPSGLGFTFTVLLKESVEDVKASRWLLDSQARVPDNYLLLGILTSDGSRWTNLDELSVEEPDMVVVDVDFGGTGHESQWTYRHWMWPLPPGGPLTFVASWPAFGVEEARAEIDATELRARAAEAEVIWSH